MPDREMNSMNPENLEQKLALAPKYGQNQAWLLLNSVLEGQEEDITGRVGAKKKAKSVQHPDYSPLKVDMKLFEAVPKPVLPNIEVKHRAKIPRGPRITWLNRSIALYLKYIGAEFLGLKSPASLFQEVKFNISFCRCAIKAAVAHETHVFNKSPNSQKYHMVLSRQLPDLSNVDFTSLCNLCEHYSQPPPAQHPQSACTAAAERVTAVQSPVDAAATEQGAVCRTSSTMHDDTPHQLKELDGCDPNGHGSDAAGCSAGSPPDNDADDEPANLPEHSGDADQPASDGSGLHCSASEPGGLNHEPPAAGPNRGKLKRDREVCSEGGDEEGAADAVKLYVDSLFESDEDRQDLSGAELSGSEEEHVPEDPSSSSPHECERQADGGLAEVSTQKTPCSASEVWQEVREFVAMCLDPWIVSGAVSGEQAEIILDKCVSKVLSAHAGCKDTAFLHAEREKIQGLVVQYADFMLQKSKKGQN